MADWLEAVVRNGIEALGREFPNLRREMEDAGGVLLYGTIGGAAYLRPDGTVWLHSTVRAGSDASRDQWHEATGNDRWAALVLGARRMPQLRRLLPVRGPDIPDCQRCGGSGFVSAGIVCPACGALGWIAAGTA